MMVAGLCSCGCFGTTVILLFEMCLEVWHCLLGGWLIFPLVDDAVEDASVFENSEDKSNGHGIGDGFSAGCSKSLTIPDAFPEILDTVLGGPVSEKAFVVGIEISRLDGTVAVKDMMQHGLHIRVGDYMKKKLFST